MSHMHFRVNPHSIVRVPLQSLKKYDIKESLSYIASLSKNKRKNLLQRKQIQLNKEYCTNKSINLSKLPNLNTKKNQKENNILNH